MLSGNIARKDEKHIKTSETVKLENALMRMTEEKRSFGCPEVTIGWYGKQRVDFMETTTRGFIKCYEIKVTKSDFHSTHGHNFVGNYNYYVMPKALYAEVKDEIPEEIGVMVGEELEVVKRCKKIYLTTSEMSKMRLYLLRSMSREVKKNWQSSDKETLAFWKRTAEHWKKMAESHRRDLVTLNKEYTRFRREARKRGFVFEE